MELEPLADPSWFRSPDPTDSTRAKTEFAKLKAIRVKATESQIYQRSDSAWNNYVHTPILDLVFTSDIPELEESAGAEYQVRCEAVISANINFSVSMLRSRGVAVDYAVVLDIPEGAPLRKVVSKLASYDLRSVNQTSYLPLRDSPIAMSIATKTDNSSRDSFINWVSGPRLGTSACTICANILSVLGPSLY